MKREDLTELHYITPCLNVASVLERGLLCHELAGRFNHSSVADEVVQRIRGRARVPNGLRLHEYVNLYINARNAMMFKLVNNPNPPLCVLAVDLSVLDLAGVVIYDGNAASDWSRPYPSPAGLAAIDKSIVFATYWTDPDRVQQAHKRRVTQAEILVPTSVDPTKVTRVYVPNDVSLKILADTCPTLTTVKTPAMFFN